MVSPFIQSPLGGNIGVRTAVIYKLDPLGIVPIANLLDLVNPFSPNKMGLDVVDSEDFSRTYTVTDNPLQDFTSATSNVHRNLDIMTVSGTLISSIDIPFIGSVGVPGIPGGFGGGLRADLLKLDILDNLANEREPIMVVTPRRSMARAFIESWSTGWNPETGDNTLVTITFKEARIVNPITAAAVLPDVASSLTGNNGGTSLGGQAPLLVQTQSVSESGIVGVAPSVIPIV